MLEGPAAPAAESRKVVTVLFIDATSSTALGERLDPESLRAAMTRYFDVMREVIEFHGVSKAFDDKLLYEELSFAVPKGAIVGKVPVGVEPEGMGISPDGRLLYVPQLEGPRWHAVNSANGDVLAIVETKSGSHNTVYALDGSRVYLAGLKSPVLSIADPKTHRVTATVGPFAHVIRPFTVNGSNTLCFVNINGLPLGHHQWRQTDTTGMIRAYARAETGFTRPLVEWRGGTSGVAETEFPLYSYAAGLLQRAIGLHHWIPRSLSIAAGLAKGHGVKEAVHTAQRYLHTAIQTTIKIGTGKGPVNHLVKVEGCDVHIPTSQANRKKGRPR